MNITYIINSTVICKSNPQDEKILANRLNDLK